MQIIAQRGAPSTSKRLIREQTPAFNAVNYAWETTNAAVSFGWHVDQKQMGRRRVFQPNVQFMDYSRWSSVETNDHRQIQNIKTVVCFSDMHNRVSGAETEVVGYHSGKMFRQSEWKIRVLRTV